MRSDGLVRTELYLMTSTALSRRAREARDWMLDSCFPLWSREGVLPNNLFREKLDITHRPLETDRMRVRVQARQTYMFAAAKRLGWDADRADRLIGYGVDAMSGPSVRADGLIGRCISADGAGLIDEKADLYDTAFVLFAYAHAAMQGHEDAAAHARQLIANVDAKLEDVAHGGYAESLPRGDRRMQNPHMHLLEANLALYESDERRDHLERASALVRLLDEKMLHQVTGTLGETFGPDWSEERDPALRFIEPGHQFEWVWLLKSHADAAHTDLNPAMSKLYDIGLRTLDAEGRVFAKATREGQIVDGSRRTWMQTEALKAHLAMMELGADEHCEARAVECFDVLMDEYLTPEGGWIDCYHADGQVGADDMPASTGYHVVLAFCELLRVTGV